MSAYKPIEPECNENTVKKVSRFKVGRASKGPALLKCTAENGPISCFGYFGAEIWNILQYRSTSLWIDIVLYNQSPFLARWKNWFLTSSLYIFNISGLFILPDYFKHDGRWSFYHVDKCTRWFCSILTVNGVLEREVTLLDRGFAGLEGHVYKMGTNVSKQVKYHIFNCFMTINKLWPADILMSML
jgi:hypothetical protein